MNLECTKFYIRYREGIPETELFYYAQKGFHTYGIETVSYDWIDDIDSFTDLGPTVGVAGYLGDVHHALSRIGKFPPPNVDYPDQLKCFMGREISVSTLGELRERGLCDPIFIKPVSHKEFSGFVWTGDRESRMRVVTQPFGTSIFTSPTINFRSEYRCIVLDNEVLDCRRYKGDYWLAPNRDVVEAAIKLMKDDSPRGYSLDWGITDDNQTLLVEMNVGYALGHYGMQPEKYAKLLSATWNEISL
jgi:ATP-grasp domain, R2K clade family 2